MHDFPPKPPATTASARELARRVNAADVWLGVAFVALAIWATFGAWSDIFRLGFRDEELSYVLLAPLVLGCLAWARRGQLVKCRVRGGWVGLLILSLGWVLYSYGYLADPVLWRTGAVVIAIGAFVAAIGSDVLWRFSPVFIACVFLIPILPNGRYHIAIPLETATARLTELVCDALNMNLERSGNLLTINGVDVTVAEACNGMRMVLTLFMVCYVVAFATPLKPGVRLMLLLASPFIAIAANVIRLIPTIWMFGNTSEQVAERFHAASGWAMMLLAFVLLMGLARMMQWTMASRNTPSPARG